MTDIEKLEQTIAVLETQRAILGDSVIDTALAPLREKLDAARAVASPALATDRRKQITVLFADVSGFTTLAETLDAEELRDLMNALWQQLDGAIIAHDGKIDKHIGDAVMALWGMEEGREDDAEQAVRAALDMQTTLRVFNEKQPQPIRIRIGLNTGPVLLGTIGTTHEFTAMGDTVNLASRLQHAAPIDQILISRTTYRQVRGLFGVQPQPPLQVRGKSEPVQTYLVQHTKPRAFYMNTRGVEGIETRLIGRVAELARLQDAFEQSVSQKMAQVITIVGEAGIGKSRLVQEFLAWVDRSPRTICLFRGRATPGMMATPYALLRDVFVFHFNISESDSLDAARAKFESGMNGLLPNDPHVSEKAHLIGHLLGWDFSASPHVRGLLADPMQIRTLALHFLTQFFHTIAQTNPVVVVLDDLHWADLASLDAFQQLLANLAPSTGFLLIGNARPTFFERYSGWDKVTPIRLSLVPLTPRDSATLVADILRHVVDVPLELSDLIVRQADGNPFYVEELIKMLIDERVIQPGETEWRIDAEELSTLRVPPTLIGVLQARLDSLPAAERLVLQQAAVIGRTFWDTAVQAIDSTGVELTQVRAYLDSAYERELLFRRSLSAFVDSCEYRFKHALLHQVVYETILKRDRPGYHVRAAQWLESICGARRNEYLGAIAEHYERAGQIERAARLWSEAGDQALRVSAFAEAVKFYARALNETPPTHARHLPLVTSQCEARLNLGELVVARDDLQTALATSLSTPRERAIACETLGRILFLSGDCLGAQQLLLDNLSDARECGDSDVLARVLIVLGEVQSLLGESSASLILHEGLELARQNGDVIRETFALIDLGIIVVMQGCYDQAEQYWRRAYELASAVGNRKEAAIALGDIGDSLRIRQDYAGARDHAQQALTLMREIGAQQYISQFLLNLAEANILLGNLSEGRVNLREGLALALKIGSVPYVINAVMNYALLAYAKGHADRALALYGMAHAHPAWHSEFQQTLNAVLARWELDPASVDAGLASGMGLDWNTTIDELMRE